MNKKFISISQYPGKTGKFFYNYFFKKYNIAATYEPVGLNNLADSISNLKDINGISVSMPFKKDIIKFLDYKDPLVENYQTCNTVKIVDNKLYGYNTDYFGMKSVLSLVEETDIVSLLGDGSMATMFKTNLKNYVQYSRRLNNWQHKNKKADVIINCTGIGTSSKDKLFETFPVCRLVIDLAFNHQTLFEQSNSIGAKYISGIEFYKFTFIKQFKIYTNIDIPEYEFDEAKFKFI